MAERYRHELAMLYNESEADAIFKWVARYYLHGMPSAYYQEKENTMAAEHVALFIVALEQLRKGKPVQYITGETEFYGLSFQVDESVLIPRPETEELVDLIIKEARNTVKAPLHILDIGTGSGCIAICLKKNLPDSRVAAMDISGDALRIANKNAINNAVDIDFIKDDILEALTTGSVYDIIVSNPPYITQREKETMHTNVLAYEPHVALFVTDERPLIFYEAIANFAKHSLKSGGFLFFEINENYGKETRDMLMSKQFVDIALINDMQGKNRIIRCRKL